MCPPPPHAPPPPPAADEQPPPPDIEPPLPADPLDAFVAESLDRQAAERGEPVTEVDETFVARALAESRRMRQETGKSNQKRAANFAAIAGRHGDAGLTALQAAMQEHAAEVLSPAQAAATGLAGETSDLEPAAALPEAS